MHECDVYLISPALLWQNYTSVCWTCHRLSDSLHLRLCSRFPPLITRCPETPQSRLVYSAQSSLEGRMGTSAGCPAVVHSFLHLSPSHFFPSFVYFHLVLFSFSPAFRFFLFILFQVLFLLFFVLIFLVFPFLSFSWLCVFLSFFLVCPCPSFFLIFLFLLFTNFFSFFTKFSIFPLLTPDFPFFHNIFDFLSSSGTFSSFFPIFCLHFLLPDLSLSFYSSWFFSVLFSPHSFLPIPSLFISYSLTFFPLSFLTFQMKCSHTHMLRHLSESVPHGTLSVCVCDLLKVTAVQKPAVQSLPLTSHHDKHECHSFVCLRLLCSFFSIITHRCPLGWWDIVVRVCVGALHWKQPEHGYFILCGDKQQLYCFLWVLLCHREEKQTARCEDLNVSKKTNSHSRADNVAVSADNVTHGCEY